MIYRNYDKVRIADDSPLEPKQIGLIVGNPEPDVYEVKVRYGVPTIKIHSDYLRLVHDPGNLKHGYSTSKGACLYADDLGNGTTTVISDEKEAVNHPDHYQGPHECIEIMEAMFGRETVKHFCMCNAFKYRFRARMKNGEEDIKKAEWYEEYLIKMGGIDNGMQEVR